MRTGRDESVLREWLNDIGNGYAGAPVFSHLKNRLSLPADVVAQSLQEAIDFCFQPRIFDSPFQYTCEIAQNAILCPKNIDVESINEMALNNMVGTAGAYVSVDEPLEAGNEFGTFRADFNIEAIHNETPSGMPPHKLSLKVCYYKYIVYSR